MPAAADVAAADVAATTAVVVVASSSAPPSSSLPHAAVTRTIAAKLELRIVRWRAMGTPSWVGSLVWVVASARRDERCCANGELRLPHAVVRRRTYRVVRGRTQP